MKNDTRDPHTTVVPIASRHLPSVTIYATGVQRYVYGQGRAVDAAKGRILPYVLAVVRKHSDGDDALAEEMFQDAMLELVQIDPSRLERGEDKWLKQKLAATIERRWYDDDQWKLRLAGVDPDSALDFALLDKVERRKADRAAAAEAA